MLKALASKYETKEFLVGDPSWFMHQIEGDVNKELLAFIASALSYGSRRQFLPKIQLLLDSINSDATGDVPRWLTEGIYNKVVPQTDACFYRLYTCQTFNTFLTALAQMVSEYGSMREFLKVHINGHHDTASQGRAQCSDANKKSLLAEGRLMTCVEAIGLLTQWFRDHGSAGVVPKDTTSSCKRVCMFLRWMVRDGSPVDLGLWVDIIDKRTLIIPMDTHVVQEAMRLGLLRSKSTSMSNAIRLTSRLAEIFPDDPTKGDFALFGMGVDEEVKNEE